MIGTSAGGLAALSNLVAQVPGDLAATICVVQHLAPRAPTALADLIGRSAKVPVVMARHGQELRAGRVYVAPPDHHMLIVDAHVEVTYGPKENLWRPSIDALFRSAAVARGPRVIGVLLTGSLDDGVAGLEAIKGHGGVSIVQDPWDAASPGMPLAAIRAGLADHVVPLGALGSLLEKLVAQPASGGKMPDRIGKTEVSIARGELPPEKPDYGRQAPYVCAECGGPLWYIDGQTVLRFRCQTGHAMTADTLLTSFDEHIENSLWVAVRQLEQRARLMEELAQGSHERAMASSAQHFAERARETHQHAARLRKWLGSVPWRMGEDDKTNENEDSTNGTAR